MAKSSQKRADFMTPFQRSMMGSHPRTHANCQSLTGVSRPGKTAQERANKKAAP